MLRRIRIILATLFFLSVTALFVDSSGTVKEWLGWTAKMQFLPALLAMNIVALVVLVALRHTKGFVRSMSSFFPSVAQ